MIRDKLGCSNWSETLKRRWFCAIGDQHNSNAQCHDSWPTKDQVSKNKKTSATDQKATTLTLLQRAKKVVITCAEILVLMLQAQTHGTSESFPSFGLQKLTSCVLLLFFSVSATIFTEVSKLKDGTYPYNTFVIPCAVEAMKLVASSAMLVRERVTRRKSQTPLGFTIRVFAAYAFPAFCYFVSNNCMFYIIRELGPTTYQLTNNLKLFATAYLMRVFLARKLSWMKWKALLLLFIGSVNAEIADNEVTVQLRGSFFGYLIVILSCFAAGCGGILSEKFLKGTPDARITVSIHWQNIQLYFFGVVFGLVSLLFNKVDLSNGVFHGFNLAAYTAVFTMTVSGLSVSFILKYVDSIAKCFVMVVSTLCVACIQSSMVHENIPPRLILSAVITYLAVDQYNADPSSCLSCSSKQLSRKTHFTRRVLLATWGWAVC